MHYCTVLQKKRKKREDKNNEFILSKFDNNGIIIETLNATFLFFLKSNNVFNNFRFYINFNAQ